MSLSKQAAITRLDEIRNEIIELCDEFNLDFKIEVSGGFLTCEEEWNDSGCVGYDDWQDSECTQ